MRSTIVWCGVVVGAITVTYTQMSQILRCHRFTDVTASVMSQIHWCNLFPDVTDFQVSPLGYMFGNFSVLHVLYLFGMFSQLLQKTM